MQFIVNLSPSVSIASARLLVFSGRRVLAALALLALLLLVAVAAAAYAIAKYWVENESQIIHHIQAQHAAISHAEQTREWQAHQAALHAEIAALNARVVALYGKGAAISGQVGLPARMFSLRTDEADAKIPMLCEQTAEDAQGEPADMHERISAHLRWQAQAVAALEMKYETLQDQGIRNNLLLSTLPMERPVLGRNWISSRYGYRKDPFTGRRAFHAGDDFAARRGTPIIAAADGLVTYAGRLGRYGNTVKLNHGGGISTLYGHMHKIHVTPGQRVRQGDVIGSVGSTGRSTGPHLHYEVRVDNRPKSVRRTIKQLRQERVQQQPAL